MSIRYLLVQNYINDNENEINDNENNINDTENDFNIPDKGKFFYRLI